MKNIDCNLCPRKCNADRINKKGFCGTLQNPVISKYMVHMWEEPPISGTRGSGTVFFTGCNLQCVFCQNHKISQNSQNTNNGREISTEQLADIFMQLQDKGVHNINLVTSTHFTPAIISALEKAKSGGLNIPIVYNSNGYENVETLKLLDGLIDIYLPDIKYYQDTYAVKYSNAPNYFEIATKAIVEMYRQVGQTVIDEDGIMQRGIIIRHLILPNLRKDAMRILDWIKENMPSAHVSLMAQYIPMYKINNFDFKEINRKITTFEHKSVTDYFFKIGLTNGFVQDKNSAVTNYIPDF